MNNDHKFGRTTTESPKLLPTWEADANFGQPVPENVGHTDTESADLLPAWEVDGMPFRPVPRIAITMTFRDDTSPAEVAADMLRLFQAANQMELADGGGGLTPGAASGVGRVVRVTLTPVVPTDATERLGRIVRSIMAPGGVAGESFEKVEARVEQAA